MKKKWNLPSIVKLKVTQTADNKHKGGAETGTTCTIDKNASRTTCS